MSVGNILGVFGSTNAYVKRILNISTPFSQAIIDARPSTQMAGAHAIWLANNQHIALETDGVRYLWLDQSALQLKYMVAGSPVFYFTDSGQLATTGGVVATGTAGYTFTGMNTLPSNSAAFDARGVIQGSGSYAMWIPDGGKIALNAAATQYLWYDASITSVGVPGAFSALTFKSTNTQVVAERRTGWTLPSGILSRATFDPSTVTLQVLGETVAALITDLFAHGLIGT
jgi:hypothetical protein